VEAFFLEVVTLRALSRGDPSPSARPGEARARANVPLTRAEGEDGQATTRIAPGTEITIEVTAGSCVTRPTTKWMGPN
jgi:hypothetical protein